MSQSKMASQWIAATTLTVAKGSPEKGGQDLAVAERATVGRQAGGPRLLVDSARRWQSALMQTVFIGFPALQSEVTDSIESGIRQYRKGRAARRVLPWTELYGQSVPIVESIRSAVREAEYCIFDISVPNANVFYEIGLAAGLGKSFTLLINIALKNALLGQAELGIFDTHRLTQYKNGGDVARLIDQTQDPFYQASPPESLTHEAPVYFQNFLVKSEFATEYLASVVQTGLHHREHDPEEDARLPLLRAHREVATSSGVFLSLLDSHVVDAEHHNLRAYLLAGLADGLGVPHIILKYGDFIAPFDLRDDIATVGSMESISERVGAFNSRVLEALQAYRPPKRRLATSFLRQLSVGASAAENELRRLESYFIETREYFRALRGEAQLVVGRKGTGKTAIFWQLKERLGANRANIVLDLKPEGYHLKKFSELVSDNFSEATHSHTMTAFWEYVLLLELAHKVLEDDEFMLGRDSRIQEPYERLRSVYEDWDESRDGDFPERLLRLIRRLTTDFEIHIEGGQRKILTTPQITEIVFRSDIRRLRSAVFAYLELKKQTYVLVDGLDKGWKANGISPSDIGLVQSLIDAGRKLQRESLREDIGFNICIFLRHDVYEFLVLDASDRGKETAIKVQWRDEAALLALINQRLQVSSGELGLQKSLTWADIASPYVAGEKSFSYLVRHSMQRPRALIDIVELCLSNASQYDRTLITAEDMTQAVMSYSVEMLQSINFEVRDLFAAGRNLVFQFVGQGDRLDAETAAEIIASHIEDDRQVQTVFDILLWLGFLGVVNSAGREVFVFDVGESLELLKGEAVRSEHPMVVIHPMFRLALQRHAMPPVEASIQQ